MLRKLFVLFWNWVAYLMHTFLLGFYVKINLSDKFYLLRNALSTVVSGCCEAISLLWVNLFKSYFFHTFSFFCGVLHLSTCLNLWVTTFPGVHTAWLATEKMVNFEFNCHRHPHDGQFLDAHRPIKPVWQHGRVSEASESEPFLPQAVTFIGQACSSQIQIMTNAASPASEAPTTWIGVWYKASLWFYEIQTYQLFLAAVKLVLSCLEKFKCVKEEERKVHKVRYWEQDFTFLI